MSSALSTAINGINQSVARATQAASSIVKASSTGEGIDKNLVKIRRDSVNIAADATVIRTDEKNQKALLDITA